MLGSATLNSTMSPLDNLLAPLVGGSIAAVASLTGVALVQFQPARARAHALGIAAFAAGVILGAAFLHLLPEAMERAGNSATGWMLFAFFVLYVLETHVVRHEHHHHDHEHGDARASAARHAAVPGEAHAAHLHASEAQRATGRGTLPGAQPLAFIAAAAFALHSSFDGLALGIGFAPSVSMGILATLGVLAHKIPEGIALAALLLRGGVQPRRTILTAAGIALLTPVCAVAAAALLDDRLASGVAMGRLLALVAGSFVYIAAADLLPEVAHHPRFTRTLLLLSGVGLVVIAGRF